MTAYQFALIRYVPDAIRQEFLNVGVVVASSSPPHAVVRTLPKREAARLKWLGFHDNVDFLRDLERDLIRSVSGGRDLSDLLTIAHTEWGGTVRISELRAALHEDPRRLCDDLYKRYVVSPRKRQEPAYRDRRFARQRVTKVLRDRLPRASIQSALRVEGRFEDHKFDIGLRNGHLLHAVAAISFELPSRDDLQVEVDACAWAISDVRMVKPELPLTVVTIGDTQKRLLDRARGMYESLGTRLIYESHIEDWARGLASELEPQLTQPPLVGK